MAYMKCVFVILAGGWMLVGAFDESARGFIDNVNLLLHEGGHIIFGFFGQFISMLGGTLMQLLMPAAVAFQFFKTRQLFSASVMGIWFGENFFHIAQYMRDARTMNLPLVGGGVHDWNYLFSRLGLLPYDQLIGTLTWGLGILTIAISMGCGVFVALKTNRGTNRRTQYLL